MSRLLLRLFGWRIVGTFPSIPKAVIVVAPHTSNWDFIIGLLAKFALGLHVTFLGKHTLFRGPLGVWMRYLGGMPVDRSQPGDTVARVAAAVQDADEMLVAIAPEGTRRAAAGWKLGFYRIAHGAGVPVVPVAIDGKRKEIRIGDAVPLTGEVAADFAALAAYFVGAHGVRPAGAAPVRPL
ncbi:MAG: 1-acyl-sn-glycerol-3-phosphate acyltransferase [Xanthomonadaceae bacterium]|nr:1-acyl-sn-glycerol-3-phosphate acyltransferase [Xanthomonadaceae bacterium]